MKDAFKKKNVKRKSLVGTAKGTTRISRNLAKENVKKKRV